MSAENLKPREGDTPAMRISVCQVRSSDSAETNLRRIRDIVTGRDADLYLFPELFLTGYGRRTFDGKELESSFDELESLSRETGRALVVGMPAASGGRTYNSLVFFSPEGTVRYDKLYLANFPPYDEGIFTPGKGPVMAEWEGFRFGLLVCYDAMFPEVHRWYAVHGADAVLMASASAESSEGAMGTVLPARSLENTVYTVFCNNTGEGPAGEYFGGSALFSPLGKVLARAGKGEEVLTAELTRQEIDSARMKRHHLADLRRDIEW